MRANQNFKLSKSTKRVLGTLHGEDHAVYKKLMILAQLHQNVVIRDKKKPTQQSSNLMVNVVDE